MTKPLDVPTNEAAMIAELVNYTGNAYPRFDAVPRDVWARAMASPGATAWLNKQCPVCGEPLFIQEAREEGLQWCSNDAEHFEMHRTLLSETPEGQCESRVSITLRT